MVTAFFVTRVCCEEVGGTATTAAITVSQDNFPIPTVADGPAAVVRVPVNADVTFTGFDHTVIEQGFLFENVGTATATFTSEDAASAADNRITTPTGGGISVLPGHSAFFSYDETAQRWFVLTGHDDGAPASATISSSQNDYAIADPSPAQFWDVTTAVNITGIVWPPGVSRMTVINKGAGTATIKHDSTSSTAANRIYTPDSADLALGPGKSLTLVRDPAALRTRVEGGTALASVALAAAGTAARTHGTLAALGSTQSDAAAIVTDGVLVTGADGTKGVRLPDRTGALVVVGNDAAGFNLKVYPPSGGRIGTAATDAAVTVATKLSACFQRLTATQWTGAFGGVALP